MNAGQGHRINHLRWSSPAWAVVALLVLAMMGALVAVSTPLALGLCSVPLVTALVAYLRTQRANASDRSWRSTTFDPVQRAALVALAMAALSTLVYRERTTDSISGNPLDSAGLVRVAFLALAGLGALRVLREATGPRVPIPLRFFGLYVVTVLPGIVVAVQPGIVAFRFVELAVVFVVTMALSHVFRGGDVPIRFVVLATCLLCLMVGAGLVLSPGRALVPSRGGLVGFRLEGVFPSQSANTVGTFGVLLFAYGIVRSRRLMWVGLALVFAAQYRTGYIATIVVLAVYLAARKGPVGKVVLIACIGLAPHLMSNSSVQEVWTRGQSQQEISGLNSRKLWWEESLKVASRSPIVGTGLSSGTRFEALAGIGRGETSTVHSTWVEAYTGTGVVGLAFLAMAFLTAFAQAIQLHRRRGDVLPLLLLTAIGVRSLTGTTIELASVVLLVFLACVIRLDRDVSQPRYASFQSA